MRFDQKKAAEYFVVAWVKDWTLRQYYKVIMNGTRDDWSEAGGMYPWLPHDINPFILNISTRGWARTSMRAINDRLWDAKGAKEQLKLAVEIEKWCSLGAKVKLNEARVEANKSSADANACLALKVESRKAMNSNHEWKVCK